MTTQVKHALSFSAFPMQLQLFQELVPEWKTESQIRALIAAQGPCRNPVTGKVDPELVVSSLRQPPCRLDCVWCSIFRCASQADHVLEWRSPLGRALNPQQLLELAVGSVIEVSNAKGVWTTAKVVKNNTKKHSYMLKVSYTGGKKKFGKDEWLKYDCGRFGGVAE